MKLARLATRAVVGGLFIGHGLQKLNGSFGGSGLEQTAKGFESMGLRPGRRNAIAAGASEAGGGALLALGAAMPLAGAALIGTMITAIRTVHWKHGVWVTKGGYEYNVVLIAVIAALIEAGPGAPSLGRERKGPGWALLALGAGAAGSFAVTELAKRQPLPEASPVGG